MPKSARLPTAIRMNADSIAGRSNGRVMVRTAREAVAPEIRAACSRSVGMRRSAAETIMYATGYEWMASSTITPSPP